MQNKEMLTQAFVWENGARRPFEEMGPLERKRTGSILAARLLEAHTGARYKVGRS